MEALRKPKKTQKSNFYEGDETTLRIRNRRKESFVVEEDVTDAIWERLHFSHSNVSRLFLTLTSVLITSLTLAYRKKFENFLKPNFYFQKHNNVKK